MPPVSFAMGIRRIRQNGLLNKRDDFKNMSGDDVFSNNKVIWKTNIEEQLEGTSVFNKMKQLMDSRAMAHSSRIFISTKKHALAGGVFGNAFVVGAHFTFNDESLP